MKTKLSLCSCLHPLFTTTVSKEQDDTLDGDDIINPNKAVQLKGYNFRNMIGGFVIKENSKHVASLEEFFNLMDINYSI